MPHIIIEHSDHLAESHDLNAVATDLLEAADASGEFARDAIKTRSIACQNTIVGSGATEYVHVTLRLIEGRSIETRASIAESLLAVLEKHFPTIADLTVEPLEINPNTYRKRAK